MRKIMIMILCGIISAHTYTAMTTVVEIEPENDTVVCEDATGNLWAFYGSNNWHVGDMCQLLMHDCGTADVTDDIIIREAYIGTTDVTGKENH